MTTTTRPVTKPTLTLDEFLALPETEPASEYVCGEVYRKPMPNELHSILQGFIFRLIEHYLETHAIGRVRLEWRCIFPGRRRTLVPDVTYVSYERWPADHYADDYFLHAVPELVIEVLSPRQNARRFAAKMVAYQYYRVRLVWVLDPQSHTITIIRPDAEPLTLHAGDTLDGADVLPNFRVAVSDIFARLPTRRP